MLNSMVRGSLPTFRDALGNPCWLPLQSAVSLASANVGVPSTVVELHPTYNPASVKKELGNRLTSSGSRFGRSARHL